MNFISTDKAPGAVGPYSKAVVYNDLIFCSGQVGKDPISNEFVSGIGEQTTQTLKNLEQVLLAAGSSKDKVLKATVYLADDNDFQAMNAAYAAFFGDHKPARSTIQAGALPGGALIEIDFIAYK